MSGASWESSQANDPYIDGKFLKHVPSDAYITLDTSTAGTLTLTLKLGLNTATSDRSTYQTFLKTLNIQI